MLEKLMGIALAGALLAGSTLQAGWIVHGVDSAFQADRDGQPHPGSLSLAMLVPRNFDAGALLCVGYANTVQNGNRGRVRARCEIARAGEIVTRSEFRSRVRGNVASDCVAVAPLEVDDLLRCDLRFRNFARLGVDDETGGDALGVGAFIVPLGFIGPAAAVEGAAQALADRLEPGARSGGAD